MIYFLKNHKWKKTKIEKKKCCSPSPSFLAFCGAAARLVTHSDHGFLPDQRLNCSAAEFFHVPPIKHINKSEATWLIFLLSPGHGDSKEGRDRERKKLRWMLKLWDHQDVRSSKHTSIETDQMWDGETIRRVSTLHSLKLLLSFYVRKAEHDTVNFFEIKLSSSRAAMFLQHELLHHTSSHSMAPSHSEYV